MEAQRLKSLDVHECHHNILGMIDIQPPLVAQTDPDRYSWCQFALHSAFAEVAKRAVKAGWDEREVAAALVDLADRHMLDLITTGELEAIIEAIKKQS
ncbi:hypothetical protein PY650_02795 [Rhizobium calliandrae]|uniref:Uncharacterized protein n=1 Tax=Rhizobium calliandrae TaxID=1312182 RepID=A0ABT7K9B3_9HYPH|nr:hypothetical protein [Rhizobium calliandrae]MDL2404600.1 hypothetical protein [Rhizobium calliandrae]